MPKVLVLLECSEGTEGAPVSLGVRHTRVGQVILVDLRTNERARIVRIEPRQGARPFAYAQRLG